MKRHLISNITLFAGLGLVAATALMTCAPKSQQQSAGDSTKSGGTASVERGKYLVTAVAGCGDCHTPMKMGPQGPEPDMSRMLSGHPASEKLTPAAVQPPWMAAIDMTFTAFSGPFGVSFTANLTPDSLTGIGAWDQQTFISALRTGKHMGKGRPILPPMPWPTFKNMTDDDLASIFMYLRSIPPVSNQVPDPIAGMMPPGGMPPGGGAPPPMPKGPQHK